MRTHKRIRIIGIGILVLLGVALLFKSIFWFDGAIERSKVDQDSTKIRLTEAELNKLQTGDIIFRRGYGLISDFIAENFSKEGYELTHCGFLVKENDTWFVYHSLSSDVSEIDGMQRELLLIFLSKSEPEKLLVSRLKGLTLENKQQIEANIEKYYAAKIPFDRKGNYNDSTRFFCSELIIKVLGDDLHLLDVPEMEPERENYYYHLNHLYDTIHFKQIINQFK